MTVLELMRRFLPFLKPFKKAAALNLTLVLLAPIAGVGVLWSLKILVDGVLVGRQTHLFWNFALTFGLFSALKISIQFAAQAIEAKTVESLLLFLRTELFGHLLSLSPGSRDQSSPGDAISRLSGDTIRAETLIYTAPLLAISDAASAVVYVALLFLLSWQLTLCTLVVVPAIIAVVNRISPLVRKAGRISRDAESQWVSLAEQRLNALPIVQTFSAEGHERAAFQHHCNKVRKMEVASLVLQARQVAIVEAIVALGGLVVLGFGAALIERNVLSVGELISFLGTIGSLYVPISSLAKAAGRFQNAAAGAQRVAEILDCPSRVRERPDAADREVVNGQIEFSNVAFSYPNGRQVLRNVSLTIEPGETIALVGPSGSGKSSLIKLLLRQYDADSGSVRLNGCDVRDLSLSSLRHAIAPVFQDAMIFNGSIASNIGYGTRAPCTQAIDVAARVAAVHSFSEAKGGISSVVGIGGSRLSGGQRQRVALARALFRNAPILVLDEATAGVDSETEECIQAALDDMRGKRTILVVAHRLSSVRTADRVVVVENGEIVESGKPGELLSRHSRCRELFAPQLVLREAAE